MFHKDTLVQTVDTKTGLKGFLSFLETIKWPILVAQNCDSFDSKVLVNALSQHQLMDKFEKVVSGFADTLPMFRHILPKETSYSQEDLVNKYLQKNYDAHNAVADCKCLEELVGKVCGGQVKDHVLKQSFSINYVDADIKRKRNKALFYPSYARAIETKHITKVSAGRLASSGLRFSHIKLGYDRKGVKGLQILFQQKDKYGRPRVGNPKSIAEKLGDFFSL